MEIQNEFIIDYRVHKRMKNMFDFVIVILLFAGSW